jgi:PadR family transcriptional regulator, regulatory protein PadR
MKNQPESVKISLLETRILAALIEEPLNAYQLARQCEADAGFRVGVSNGSLYPALKRLQEGKMIEDYGASKGSANKKYRLTGVGRLVLDWEWAALKDFVRTIDGRLKKGSWGAGKSRS